jgi:hypothetical protein
MDFERIDKSRTRRNANTSARPGFSPAVSASEEGISSVVPGTHPVSSLPPHFAAAIERVPALIVEIQVV